MHTIYQPFMQTLLMKVTYSLIFVKSFASIPCWRAKTKPCIKSVNDVFAAPSSDIYSTMHNWWKCIQKCIQLINIMVKSSVYWSTWDLKSDSYHCSWCVTVFTYVVNKFAFWKKFLLKKKVCFWYCWVLYLWKSFSFVFVSSMLKTSCAVFLNLNKICLN